MLEPPSSRKSRADWITGAFTRSRGLASLVRPGARRDAALSLLLSAAYFQVVWGLSIVAPTNLDWVFAVERDLTRALTVVAYFRTSPWSFPITAFDGMLYPVGTSVTIGDGIPGLAVAYKLLDPLLPARIYQYFGVWLFACVWLQAFLSKRILSRFGLPTPVQWAGVLLSTADLPQAFAVWHAALWAHWTYLAGFLLVLEREFPLKRTCALVFVVPWIHPYLLAMVLATVVASFIKHRRTRALPLDAALVAGTLLLSSFLVGYFHFPTGEARLGRYQADLFALFNSGSTGLVPELFPLVPYDEGYAYLGLGGLALCSVLIVTTVVPRLRAGTRSDWPLAAVCIVMGLYSLSATPKVLDRIFDPIPGLADLVAPVQARLRCNGRFMWPLWHYVMLFGVRNAWWLLRDQKRAGAALASVVALQAADVGPWLWKISRPIPDAPAVVRETPELAARLTKESRLLLFVPPVLRVPCEKNKPWRRGEQAFWGAALFGARHGLKTNSDFYALARVARHDSKTVCRFTERIARNRADHAEVIFVEP